MSKIQVDAIEQQTACGTTLTAGGGAGKTVVVDATTVTLGRCGGTVALASGASQTGFGRTGTVDWQTAIKTSTITAVNGEGYFVNTTGGSITANLPAGVVGAIVSFKDYAQTFDTNALIIAANGSEKIEGQTFNLTIGTEGAAVTLVYGDATKGWQAVNSNEITNTAAYVEASGGTETTSGDYKIHTFTGPGTFTVSSAGNASGSTKFDYMVVAGGGGGGNWASGGGGGGGFRESVPSPAAWTASPIANPGGALTAAVQAYPVTVGASGAGSGGPGAQNGVKGSDSIFAGITSTGGGFGAGYNVIGGPGGSGGGGGHPNKAGGSGDDPDVTPNQGFPGGLGNTGGPGAGAGGGGGTEVGQDGNRTPGNFGAGRGGSGATSSITASPVGYAGGGGGGSDNANMGGASPCGSGGQGGGANNSPRGATAGATNRGGGGGATGGPTNPTGGSNGGSGVVVVRYKFQN